jgi:hypothetical protein
MPVNTTRLAWVAMAIAALLWWQYRASPAANANATAASVQAPSATPAGLQASALQLPSALERYTLEPAGRDPFTYVLPPAPPAPKKPPPTPIPMPMPVQAPVMAAPVPTAPSLDLQYAGRMTTPDGVLMVFATYGQEAITLAVGQSLPNGYRVDRISDRVVELSYPALGTTARLDLPEPPKYEIR